MQPNSMKIKCTLWANSAAAILEAVLNATKSLIGHKCQEKIEIKNYLAISVDLAALGGSLHADHLGTKLPLQKWPTKFRNMLINFLAERSIFNWENQIISGVF